MNKVIRSILIPFSIFLVPATLWAADYEFTFQSVYNGNVPSFHDQQAWLESLEKETNGRLKINIVSNGEIVRFDETLDAMRLGLLDGHITLGSFSAKKDPAFMLLTNTVGAWESGEQAHAFMRAEGDKLLRELLKKYNVHLIATLNRNIESLVSKKPTKGPADFAEMNFRVVDSMTKNLLTNYGVKAIPIAMAQVVDGIKQGILDGADMSTITNNQTRGANDVAPNPIYPGIHVPIIDISMNQAKWDALPSDIQKIVTNSAQRFAKQVLANSIKRDNETLNKIKSNPKITVNTWSSEEREKLRLNAKKEWEKVSKTSPFAKKAYDKLINYINNRPNK